MLMTFPFQPHLVPPLLERVLEASHLPVACRGDLLCQGSPSQCGGIPGLGHSPPHQCHNLPSSRRAFRHMHTGTAAWTQDLAARRSLSQSSGRPLPGSPSTPREKEA
jgi:hypothetical protein